MKATTQKITKADYEILAAFRYSLRQFLRFSEDAALAVNLASQQHQALLAIKGFPNRDYVTIGELAERLQLRHNSAVELAGRLVDNRLAKRKQDPADRRQAILTLTARGEALLAKLSSAHRAELRRVGPQIEALLKELQRSAGKI